METTVDVELFRRKFCMLVGLSDELVKAELVKGMGTDLLLRMTVTEYHQMITKVEYPADWWEAFKERWLPFLEVRRKQFSLEVAYPQFVPIPNLGPALSRVVPVFKEGA